MYGNFGAGGEDFGFGFGVGFGVGEGADGSLPMKLTETLFQGGKAPKLKSISLSMVSLNTNKPIPYLGSLTTLQITELEDAYQMSIWAWLDIVRQTPQLHTLILRSTFSPDEPPPSPPPSSPTLSHSSNGTLSHNVVLKKLKFIELKGALMECCEFLEKLVVPGECRLMMGCSRANNVNAVRMLGGWLKERKMRSEQMEGILKTPLEVLWECERERRRGRCLLVHPSVAGLSVRVNEGGGSTEQEGLEREGEGEEDEGECVVNLDLTFGFTDQSEERHRLVIEIFDVLTSALQVVYEDKGGFDALNLSLFGVRDGMRFWRDELTRFLGSLDRVEHLQEMSGYTASVVFPLLVQSPHLHQRRGSAASVISTTSTSPAERFRQNMLLPSLSRITLAFVEFAKNVDDEFEASCDVHAVPDFVKRRYGLGKEVGGISVVRQRVGSVKVRFECCSGPKSILDELRRLGVDHVSKPVSLSTIRLTMHGATSLPLLLLSLVSFLLILPQPSLGIKFSLQAFRYPPTKCIWNAAHPNTLVIVTANVGPNESQRMDIEIVDSSPQKNVYLSKRDIKGESRLAVTTHGEGEVGVCFKNHIVGDVPYDKALKLASVVDLDVDIGADAVDYNAIANQESLSSLETEMRKLEGEVKEIMDEMEYLKKREERFTSTNTSTNARVQNFAWFSILSLAALGVWQVLHLRAYFKRKYLID
ncbi:hypothetical protein NP233_g9736 [Leucocoprinus birnbaumii]|uniref:GOLD domain-containing protein n=1 Tax=Leucocoprinus birnbaumii TaxID=56174 RepID=A0AAD5VNE1_9AGAR|nr:hypothetical protein NP233_g9736 [Leucocoprinus birnbaumii]